MKIYVKSASVMSASFTFDSTEIGEYYICISQNKYETTYKVEVYISNTGRLINSNTYSTLEKAKARYKMLCHKYEKES